LEDGDPKTASIDWPCGEQSCRFYLAGLDEYGNEIAWQGSPDAPLDLEPPRPHVGEPMIQATTTEERTFFEAPAVYFALASGAAALTGAYFGSRFASEQRMLTAIDRDRASHTLAEAQSVDSSRIRNYGLMWTGFGIAAVFALLAAFTW
jgi:hypothetical protein